MIYAPYDIAGIKFLWWTWHDTDSAIAARLFGVPIGSSMSASLQLSWRVRLWLSTACGLGGCAGG